MEAVLTAPDMAMTALDPGAAEPGTVMVAWSAEQQGAVVMADDLAPAPTGMAYELWLIGADGPVPMRLLDPATDGSVHRLVPLEGRPAAWGVTLEPAGGSPSPTGEIIYQAPA